MAHKKVRKDSAAVALGKKRWAQKSARAVAKHMKMMRAEKAARRAAATQDQAELS